MHPKPNTAGSVRVPRTRVEAMRTVTHIGMAINTIGRIKRRYDEKIAKHEAKIALLKKEREEDVAPHADEAKRLGDALRRYAEANKETLTRQGKEKTVKLSSGGTFQWYTPGAYVLHIDESRFYDEVKKLGYGEEFIRTTEEPNKAALRETKNAGKVEELTSVTKGRSEKFVVRPANTDARFERAINESDAEWEIVPKKEK